MPARERIRALAINVDEESARQKLAGSMPLALMRKYMSRRLSRLALVFVPFWSFDAEIDSVSFRERYGLSLDAAKGVLDPYRSETSANVEIKEVQASNCVAATLSEQEVERRVVEVVRKEVYLKGFHRIRQLRIATRRTAERDFYVPYWIGFYGQVSLTFSVLNANSGRREGKKACELFHHWLVH